MRIINGRKLGDVCGKLTYYGPQCNHPTTVDYSLCHEDIMDQILSFKICDFTPFSDHCQIVTNIKMGSWSPAHQKEDTSLKSLPDRFVWDKAKQQQFINNLSNENVVHCWRVL